MTRSAAAVVVQPSLATRRAGLGRVITNSPSPWPKRRRPSATGPRGDSPDLLTILTALEQTSATVGIVDGRIVHWSRGAERLYGWTADDAIGCRAGDLLKQNGAGASEASAAAPRRGGVWGGEFSRSHKDEHELAIAAHRVSRRDADGRVKVIEQNGLLEPAAGAADPPTSRVRQAEANGCSTHRIAHDFNNLLGIITLNLELARERAAGGGELCQLIDEALNAAWQGSELTSRLTDSIQHRPA